MTGKNVLITGGTGAFGTAMVKRMLTDPHGAPDRIVIFSRDEHKHMRMAQALGTTLRGGAAGSVRVQDRLRFFLGDVKDGVRLQQAMRGCDTVLHAAALKVVPALEYNPGEGVKTNVIGAMNVVQAALATPSVERVIGLSSDKACSPVNLYGATKLCAEKILVGANRLSGADGPRFSAVRYGNVSGSTGSVIPLWTECLAKGKRLPVTNLAMTRFWMSLGQAVAFVDLVAREMMGGEVWVPKLPAYDLRSLAMAMTSPEGDTTIRGIEEIGIRAGEKMHESMISEDEAAWTWDTGVGQYVIVQDADDLERRGWDRVPLDFSFSSDGVSRMPVENLRRALSSIGWKAPTWVDAAEAHRIEVGRPKG